MNFHIIKNTAMNRFLSVITIVITCVLFCIVFLSSEDQNKISYLEVKVDSLMLECSKKDTMIDEATMTAIQLSDKLNMLYEKNPRIHKEVFSETD
jgi:hypothetical protein